MDRPARKQKAPEGECTYCDRCREENSDFHPYHDASLRCQSGQRTHCTCGTCW